MYNKYKWQLPKGRYQKIGPWIFGLNILNWNCLCPKAHYLIPTQQKQNMYASPVDQTLTPVNRLAPNQQAFHSKRNSPTSLVCQGFGLSHDPRKTCHLTINIFSLQVFKDATNQKKQVVIILFCLEGKKDMITLCFFFGCKRQDMF